MSAGDIQALLRFLTNDAKVPLAKAMGGITSLRNAELDTIESLSKAKAANLAPIFSDDKLCKSVVNAAKRISKKRVAGEEAPLTSSAKRTRRDPFEVTDAIPPAQVEQSLSLVPSQHVVDDLEKMVFITNRAPLVLAFAATCVKFTMPEQPPSSRLSLAQAVVSLGSQSKAKAIGLSSQPSAEDEGWAHGQPVVKLMNRDISVLKRWGYDWKPEKDSNIKTESDHPPNFETLATGDANEPSEKPALWALDLEKLKTLNGPLTFSTTSSADTAGLPVYSPQSARAYMFRSFDSRPSDGPIGAEGVKAAKKKTAASAAEEREKNVAALLQALELLFLSWRDHLSTVELDKKCWSWYVMVRPEVEYGVAGWGAKGEIKLKDVLDLRRKIS